MKTLILLLALLTLLFTACSPTAISAPAQPVESNPTQPQAPLPDTPTPAALAQTLSPAKAKDKKATPAPKSTRPTASGTKSKTKESIPVPTSSNSDFVTAAISGRPTSSSVTINIVPVQAIEVYFEYGTTSGAYSDQTKPQTASAGKPLEVLLDGLQPNTIYYYRLRYGSTAGPEQTFATQRAPGAAFVFDIQGDSHPERVGQQFDPNLYTRTLQSAAADHPDFYMTIGDDFSVDTLKTVNQETVTALYVNQRQWLNLVNAPVFLVNGNHEQASMANLDGTPNNVAVWAQTARNLYYPQPAPDNFYTGDLDQVDNIGLLRDYYAFTWGDALFVVIDPYWHSAETVDNTFGAGQGQKAQRDLWNVTLGEAQYQWLQRTLETSKAKYKFVFAHHVNGTGRGGVELANTFEWGDAANFAAHRPGWGDPIHQLMVENHVTIFFQGHDHLFARQELDGVIYQTLPEPANPFYTVENNDAYRSGDKVANSGHLRVSVSAQGVTVDYVRSYLDKPDELAYTYTVK